MLAVKCSTLVHMSYEVGTHLDLRPNRDAVQSRTVNRLYVPGTRVLFVDMISDFTVLKITRNSLALGGSLSA